MEQGIRVDEAGKVSGDVSLSKVEIDQRHFCDVVGHFASGLTLITGGDGTPHGLTCQSFFSLSLDPPLVAFAPSKVSQSWPKLSRGRMICVNILAADQHELARVFSKSGVDKFVDVPWYRGSNGAPRIRGSLAWIDCAIEQLHDAGDHHLVIARVLATEINVGEPLLFYRSSYGGFVNSTSVS